MHSLYSKTLQAWILGWCLLWMWLGLNLAVLVLEHPARDPDAFSILKDITSLNSWLVSFMDVAWTQSCSVGTVLEKSYTPINRLDTELFMANQRFLFDVIKSFVAMQVSQDDHLGAF